MSHDEDYAVIKWSTFLQKNKYTNYPSACFQAYCEGRPVETKFWPWNIRLFKYKYAERREVTIAGNSEPFRNAHWNDDIYCGVMDRFSAELEFPAWIAKLWSKRL